MSNCQSSKCFLKVEVIYIWSIYVIWSIYEVYMLYTYEVYEVYIYVIYTYIYIYTLHHVAFGHFIPSIVLFSLQISKYYWVVFVWRWFLCLIFTVQHILIIFFLSEFNFESFIILFVAVFIYRPTATFSELKFCDLSNMIVQRVQQTKLDSESFVNVYWFFCYLSVVFLIYSFCLSICFARSIPI